MQTFTPETIKNTILPILKEKGVLRSSLFGSYVRGDATEHSDIDILVELPEAYDLFDLMDIQSALEERLHKKVDVVTYQSVHPLLKDSVFKNTMAIL